MPNTDRNLHPVNLPAAWSSSSWRSRTAMQLPTYPDQSELEGVLAELRGLPPLVTSWEILALKQQVAEAQEAGAFCCKAAIAPKPSTPARRKSFPTGSRCCCR